MSHLVHTSQPASIALSGTPEETVITLAGDLDVAGAVAIADELRWVAADGTGDVIADCARLGFVDSSGLRLLVEAESMIACRGHRFTLRHRPPSLDSLLRMCGLSDLLG